jgi:hypothetical protein
MLKAGRRYKFKTKDSRSNIPLVPMFFVGKNVRHVNVEQVAHFKMLNYF